MKPTVPDTGTIIRLEGDKAVVILKGGPSCKGCGAAKIGLCRAAGGSMMVTVLNQSHGRPGDVVQIGIDRSVRVKGYFLAYVIPVLSFIAGALLGHALGIRYSVPSLDVLSGFAILGIICGFTFNGLRKLDQANRLIAKKIVSDGVFRAEVKSDEERRFESYALNQ